MGYSYDELLLNISEPLAKTAAFADSMDQDQITQNGQYGHGLWLRIFVSIIEYKSFSS